MRRINKVILIFIIFIVAIFYGVIEVVQSDFLGKSISLAANKALESKYGFSVKLQNVKFQLFPPGIEIQNVQIDDLQEKRISFKAANIGAYFDLGDIFLDRPTISELMIGDANLVLTLEEEKKNNGENKNFSQVEVSKYISLFNKKSVVDFKKINITESTINFNNANFTLNKLLIRKRTSSLKVHVTAYNLDVSKLNKKIPVLESASLSVVVNDSIINVKNSLFKKGASSLSAQLKLDNNFNKINLKGSANLKSEISEVSKYVDISKIGELNRGVINARTKFEVSQKNFNFTSDLNLTRFVTDFCYGDKLDLAVQGNNEKIYITNFNLISDKQEIKLDKKFEFLDLKSNKFIEEDILVSASNLKLNNGLRFLRENLDILKGELSGKLRFKLNPDNFHFIIEENLSIKNLYLGDLEKPILSVEKGNISSAKFSVDNGRFNMNANIELPNSKLQVKGEISKENLNFNVSKADIDFSDFGKFAGFTILGRGDLDLEVFRDKSQNVLIGLSPNLKNFSFENYQAGDIKGGIIFNLTQGEISLNGINAIQGKAKLMGDALLNYKSGEINSDLRLQTKRYVDLKRILYPLLSPLTFIPDDVFGDWKINTRVSGKMDLDSLKVDLKLDGNNNYIYDESFEKLQFNLLLESQVINLSNIYARKSDGELRGEYAFNLINNKMNYDLRFSQIPLRDINVVDRSPFEFDSSLSGFLVGSSDKTKNKIDLKVDLTDTYVSTRKVQDSSLSFNALNDDYKLKFNLFGSQVLLNADISSRKDKTSKILLDVNTYDIPLYLSVFKFVDKSTLNMNGVLALRAELDFPGTNYQKSNFSLLLKRFIFKKESVDINYLYRKQSPQLILDDGLVKNWNLEIEGRKFYLISKGEGDLKKNYQIQNKFKIDASVLETMNKIVSKANGTLRGDVKFFDNKNKPDYEAKLISNNLSFSTKYLPTEIKDTKLALEYKNKEIIVQRLEAGLSAGFINLNGNIDIKNIIPELDLSLNVREAGFPIFGKSSVVVSAVTNLIGNKPPYALSGDVVIDKLLVVNDVQDFTTGKDAIIKKEYDYLPKEDLKVFSNYLALNLNISTKEPMYVSNSFADIGMTGDLQLIGGENDPKLVGSLSLAPRTNKITFKNNDYLINKGNVFFNSQKKITNPELDFIAESNINDYKVNLKVYGPVKDFTLDLTSTPALAQEDILSLIAFGYTKDLSANLTDAERESMTQAGVGSILFDSFKINETLKSEFGLQVNLGTQIQQDETSLLNQRNADNTRVRSATTIEVKKKLNDAMNLSVSSTVGGSAGQRQSMNLNYNLNKNISVEGVYETRTAPEGEEAIINDTSFGADVKMRWSFK